MQLICFGKHRDPGRRALVQAGIESRARQRPGNPAARQKAREWLERWERLSDDLNSALPAAGGSIVEEMIEERDRRC